MKLTIKDFIPIYGSFHFFNRHFNANKRGSKEAKIAIWMAQYHTLVVAIFLLFLMYRISIL
jgi:hypothetical protein